MTEPLTALLYIARDFQKRYGAPCRVEAAVDSGGYLSMKVFAWINGKWQEQQDAFSKDGDPILEPAARSQP